MPDLEYLYNDRIVVLGGEGPIFSIHVYDDPRGVDDPVSYPGDANVITANSIDDCFAQLDARQQRGEWPFDKETPS